MDVSDREKIERLARVTSVLNIAAVVMYEEKLIMQINKVLFACF